MKKIQSVKYNGRVEGKTRMGESLGSSFVTDEEKLDSYGKNGKKCISILESGLTTYDINYENGDVLRIFNPVEVLWIEVKS